MCIFCILLLLIYICIVIGLFLVCVSICNLLLMRNSELFIGIEVEDYNGNVIGKFKVVVKKVKKNFVLINKKKNVDLFNVFIFI